MQNLYPIWGGAEKSADTLIKTLQDKGHTVDWMCQTNESEAVSYTHLTLPTTPYV